MTSAVVATALFVLGVCVCVRTLAALYRVLDLWYAIGTVWPGVVRGIATWAGTTIVIASLLRGGSRSAFLSGFAAYVVFYLAVALLLSRVIVPRVAARIGADASAVGPGF